MTHNLELEQSLKELIIETLNLDDVSADQIDPDQALFVSGLGLDSIDALELGLAIKKKYKVEFSPEEDANHEHFASVRSLAAYIGNKSSVI